MTILELACAAIVAVFVIARATRDPAPKRFLGRMAALSALSWLGEDTVIRAYGFYTYSPEWSLFVDRVPILIVLIWPVVIHSAFDLAKGRPLVAGAIILLDASLIEPIAVSRGLWVWSEPGIFGVPPIGIAGWAVFGALAIAMRERWWWVVVPLTHAVLIALWWGLFRWISAPIAPVAPVVGIGCLSLAASAWALRRRLPVARIDLLLRVPAAAFFFVLLALGSPSPHLVAYAIAFAPPYLVLTWRS